MMPMKCVDELRLRDPFIHVDRRAGLYYLFGTRVHEPRASEVPVYKSRDLVHWDGPRTAFAPPAGFWADRDLWAPEVWEYRGRWYLFLSVHAEGAMRGTQVFVADHPAGPYAPHAPEPVTPRHWMCLDGTLFVNSDGTPWMVFCHEWAQVTDGTMCAMRLTDDLRAGAGEPVVLFHASDAPWTTGFPEHNNAYVTDGPQLVREENGELVMFWSSFRDGIYCQGIARSASGKITGPWVHDPEPIFSDDGGHGMPFTDLEGRRRFVLHAPNNVTWRDERVRLFELARDGARYGLK